jgi:glycosyltransferase involved in cell wall biosynthesis
LARDTLAASQSSHIELTGRLDEKATIQTIQNARFVVIPSVCNENFPLVLLEAFASGVPVIVSKLGSLAELVVHGFTGLHFEAGNTSDLIEKARWAWKHSTEMGCVGENAYQEYTQKYSPDKNYQQLMAIYQQAISASKRRKHEPTADSYPRRTSKHS